MYEHKGFIALLRYTQHTHTHSHTYEHTHRRNLLRFDRLSGRRKMENRNFETSLLFETWVSPVHNSRERNQPSQRIFYRLLYEASSTYITDNADRTYFCRASVCLSSKRYVIFRGKSVCADLERLETLLTPTVRPRRLVTL